MEVDKFAMPPLQDVHVYKLSTVVEKTGLKADTIRAWERRYGLPKPERTPGGHRLYSRRDIAILQWLAARLDEGMRISAAVALWRELSARGQDGLAAHSLLGSAPSSQLEGVRTAWLNACLAFDEVTAEQVLNQAFALHDVEKVCLEVLGQGLQQIGEQWYRDQITVQQEHFATELVVQRLHALIRATPQPTRPETVIIATPSGERHSVPALLLALLLRRRGRRVLYLGTEVPIERLCTVLEDANPAVLVLSAQMLSSASALFDIAQVTLESGIPVGYGGRIFNILPQLRQRMPGYFLGEALETALAGIEMLISEDLPMPKGVPAGEVLTAAAEALMRAGDAIAFDVKQRMAALNVGATYVDTALLYTHQQLLAALSLGDINLMQGELAWVEGLLEHRRVDPALLLAFWRAYRDAVLRHTGVQGQVIADWLADHVSGIERQ